MNALSARGAAAARVFLLPFAGGSAYSYAPILGPRGAAAPGFAALELPGRGARIAEPLPEGLEARARDALARIAPRPGDPPYVLFGHSMGALVAWLAAREARRAGLPLPRALVLSGMRGPSLLRPRDRHALPPGALREELRRLGATAEAVLADAALFAFFEPIIRSDFRAVDTSRHAAEPPLPVPVTLLLGTEDDVTEEAARAWQRETTEPVALHHFPGGHFFLFDHAEAVRALIARAAAGCAAAAA